MSQRVAMITGAASGIGRATATRFASEGLAVVCIDRDEPGLGSLRKELPGIVIGACDITDHQALAAVVDRARKELGSIDILVNNAGISFYERLAESTLEHWRVTQAVNVESMYALTKLVVPIMKQKAWGRVVNVSSTQSIAAEAIVGAYAASKGAIAAWTRALAVDLAEYGILVNAVAPGCTRTPMSIIGGVDETTTPMFQEWYVRNRKIPLARPGQPEEIAKAIYFLSGDECTYITGHTLVVDGGLTITF